MSYDLYLRFKPPLSRERFGRHLGRRGNYSSSEGRIEYNNPQTGVYFWLAARGSRFPPWDSRVSEVHFEINYGRPSYFALEADIEIRALIDEFRPTIEDPQMHGMGAEPYSTEGFLRGWTFGNEFFASNRIGDGDIGRHHLVPADVLRDVWEWNYRRRERMARLGDIQFFPEIRFWVIDGRAAPAAVWGEGMPIMLPKVDYVFIGRYENGERRMGLVAWSELLKVVGEAGFEVRKTPLDLYYKHTPQPIARWVAEIPLVESPSLRRVEPEELLDEEVVAGGQHILDSKTGVSTTRFEL